MSETREGRIRREITRRLRERGWLVIRTDAARNHSLRKGWPDLLALRPEHAIMIEIKTPRYRSGKRVWQAGRLSPEQSKCHDWLRAKGYEVRVVRSTDDVEDMLIFTS